MDGSNTTEPDFVARVRAAQALLQPYVLPTKLIPVRLPVGNEKVDVLVAYEGHQDSGSSLIRPAYLNVLEAPPGSTIVCGAGGNFAAAVACAASRLGRAAVIFVPDNTPVEKLTAIGRHHPLALRLFEGGVRESEERASAFAQTHDGHLVSEFHADFRAVAAGTLAAEILDAVPDVTECLVASGGAGLRYGMGYYFGERVRVVSVDLAGSHSKTAPTPEVEEARRRRSEPLVSGAATTTAQKWLWAHHGLPAEFRAVSGLAALVDGSYRQRPDGRTVAVVWGSSVNPRFLRN